MLFDTFLELPSEDQTEPTMRTPTKRRAQVDVRELPSTSCETFVFKLCFAIWVLRNPFGGCSRQAPHFQNKRESIDLPLFLTVSLDPTLDAMRNVKNCKASATLHGSAPTKRKTTATLHGNASFARLVQDGLSKRLLQECPKPFIQ